MGKIKEFDGNTAALAAYHAGQDQDDLSHELFGESVLAELTEDLMSGRVVSYERDAPVDLAWIFDDADFIPDGEAALLVGMSHQERADYWVVIDERARELVVQWLNTSPIAAAVIAERVRDRVLEASEV